LLSADPETPSGSSSHDRQRAAAKCVQRKSMAQPDQKYNLVVEEF